MDIKLVPVEPSDAESLVQIRILAMKESLERIGRFDPQRARSRFLATFSPIHTRYIYADESRAGFVTVKPDNAGLLLDHLYITPERQKIGIGALVLKVVFAEADKRGVPIRVGALKGSDSNRFYLRHGFTRVEEGEWDIYYVRQAQNST